MDFRLLRAFVHTARATTISQAAASLSITQPALTKQIQQLESLVGAALFRRGRYGSELTATGEALLDDARTIVDLVDRFRGRAARIASGEEGQLAVGFGLSSISVAPRAVAAFRATSPGVTVRLEDLSSTAQLDGVRAGHLDIAFVRLPVPAGLRSVRVLSDSLALARPAGEPAPPHGAGRAEWFASHPLIRLSTRRGPGLAAQISRHLSGIGAEPAIAQEADDLQTVLALVAAGVGSAIVPESARNIAPAGVDILPLRGPDASWQVGAVWRSDNETPAVRAFLAELATITAGDGSPRQD